MRWRNWLEAKLPRIFRTTCVSDFLVELQLLLLKLCLSNGAWNQLYCREPRRPVRPPQLWAGNLTQKPLSWVTGALGSFLPTNTRWDPKATVPRFRHFPAGLSKPGSMVTAYWWGCLGRIWILASTAETRTCYAIFCPDFKRLLTGDRRLQRKWLISTLGF